MNGRQTFRDFVRARALDLLSLSLCQSPFVEEALRKPRLHVLNLHHVLPDEEEGFAGLLEWLVESGHNLVTLSQGLTHRAAGRLTAPSIAFTFDDGFASCLRAADILSRYGVTGSFFLITEMVGERNPSRIARFCRERLHCPPTPFLDWKDVDYLQQRGHDIGSHSHSHREMSRLGNAQLDDEVGLSKRILTEHCGDVSLFSWPYGRFHHFSAGAMRAVFRAGYTCCLSAERGAHLGRYPIALEELCVRREPIVAAWPLRHIQWFLARSALRSQPEHERWPTSWDRSGGSLR